MPPPRPFRVTRCTIRDRDELVEVLRLVDAALQIRSEEDGDAAMRVVYDVLAAAEPSMSLVRDEFVNAASWGAAFHRLQLGESPLVPASSLRADAGFVNALLWNALAWTGIEVSCRLEPRLSALGDYCVKVGYYVAHHGRTGAGALEAELASWAHENEQVLPDYTFRAYVESQLIGEFWIDVDSAPHARSAMPIRPARSIEKVYDDLLFDIAWDDLNDALGRGRPRKTSHLENLAPVEWEPKLTSQSLFFLPHQSNDAQTVGADLSSVLSGVANGAHESTSRLHRMPAPPAPVPPAFEPVAAVAPVRAPEPAVASGPLVLRSPAAVARDVPPLVMRPAPAVPPMAPAPVAPPANGAAVPMAMAMPPANGSSAPMAMAMPPANGSSAPMAIDATIDLRPVVVPAPTMYDYPPPQRLDIPAGWYKDPRRRFEFRWWDGSRWTDVVSHDGTPTHDPLKSPQPTTTV